MKLMKKPRGSLHVLPAAAAADCGDAELFPPSITGWLAIVFCVVLSLCLHVNKTFAKMF